MKYIALLLTLSITILVNESVWAWSIRGHARINELAYKRLEPQVKKAVDTLVNTFAEQHQDFFKKCATSEDRAKCQFAHAGTWFDVIRAPNNPFAGYHFIAYPFTRIPDQNDPLDTFATFEMPTIVNKTKSTKTFVKFDSSIPSTQLISEPPIPNALDLIEQSRWLIEHPGYNEYLEQYAVTNMDRAPALVILTHVLADIHQPFHAITYFDAQRYPSGDFGGNAVCLQHPHRDGIATNLHSLWDRALLATTADMRDLSCDSFSLTSEVDTLDPKQWTLDSNQIAQKAYYDDTLFIPSQGKVVRFCPNTNVKEYYKLSENNYMRPNAVIAHRRFCTSVVNLARYLNHLNWQYTDE